MRNVENTSECDEKNLISSDSSLYKTILETSMDGFWMVDANGNILEVNNAYCKLSGYSRKELLSMNISNVEVQESHEKIKKHIKLVQKTGSHRFITKHRFKNGKIIELEVSANHIKHDKIVSFAYLRDITEKKQIEKALLKAKQDWENIFQAIGQPSFILDPTRKIIAANRATVKMTGKTEEQLIGKKCFEILHKKDSFPEECPLEKLYSSGGMEIGEMEVEALEGTYLVSCTPVFNDEGVLEKVIHIATDITERKQTERNVQEYQKQLKQMSSELLIAEENERHRIAAGIHDDVGQRLAIIKYGLDSLQSSETRSDILVSLRRQSKLISSAIEEIRSFTFELSSPILYEIGIEAAIEKWMNDYITSQHGIKCKYQIDGPKINLSEKIKIILFQGARELLTNILKHAQADAIEVNIHRSINGIRITVKDNGIGFICDIENSTVKRKNGFGLFNLREKLEFVGGRLEIQNASPKGTLITMYVPIKNKDEKAMERLS